MSRTILVPLDGSPFAERVLPVASALARKLRVPLELLLVHPPVVLGYARDMRHATMDAETEDRIADEGTYLAGTADRLRDANTEVHCTLLASRSVPEAICERAIAAATICTDSAYLGSAESACRFCLLVFAGFEMRPSTNLSSPASATRRAHSSAESRFFILSSMAADYI